MAHSKNNIRTYTGLYMDPFEIVAEQVRIEDIAHSLSMMVRANGHLNRFFSIAQHCLACAKEAQARRLSRRIQLACLLHDAAECYLADIPRPVKHRLTGYGGIEDRVTESVFHAFGLADMHEDELKAVYDIDDAMLYYEFEALTGAKIADEEPYMAMRPDFSEKKIEDVEGKFLQEFKSLTN